MVLRVFLTSVLFSLVFPVCGWIKQFRFDSVAIVNLSRNVIVTSQAGLHVAIFKLAKSSEAMIFRHMALLSCAGQLIFFF